VVFLKNLCPQVDQLQKTSQLIDEETTASDVPPQELKNSAAEGECRGSEQKNISKFEVHGLILVVFLLTGHPTSASPFIDTSINLLPIPASAPQIYSSIRLGLLTSAE